MKKIETRGRPRITGKDDPLIGGSVKMTESQWAKFKALGSSDWLRNQLNSIFVAKKKESK